jgi:hypothetical protein
MRLHLFEFHSEKKKVKCICGWERTLKTADVRAAHERFKKHCAEQAALAAE